MSSEILPGEPGDGVSREELDVELPTGVVVNPLPRPRPLPALPIILSFNSENL